LPWCGGKRRSDRIVFFSGGEKRALGAASMLDSRKKGKRENLFGSGARNKEKKTIIHRIEKEKVCVGKKGGKEGVLPVKGCRGRRDLSCTFLEKRTRNFSGKLAILEGKGGFARTGLRKISVFSVRKGKGGKIWRKEKKTTIF